MLGKTLPPRILTEPGRLVLDRCFVSELVYGPLRHGGSRLAWNDAIEFSEILAAGEGAFLHLTGVPATIRHRLIDRGDTNPPAQSELDALVTSYQRVFNILGSHAPVIHIGIGSR